MVLINQYEDLRKQIVMPNTSFSIKGMGYAIMLHKGMLEWCRICEMQNESDMSYEETRSSINDDTLAVAYAQLPMIFANIIFTLTGRMGSQC
jgi:hypothetical protein